MGPEICLVKKLSGSGLPEISVHCYSKHRAGSGVGTATSGLVESSLRNGLIFSRLQRTLGVITASPQYNLNLIKSCCWRTENIQSSKQTDLISVYLSFRRKRNCTTSNNVLY
jgi:hypothetical protein